MAQGTCASGAGFCHHAIRIRSNPSSEGEGGGCERDATAVMWQLTRPPSSCPLKRHVALLGLRANCRTRACACSWAGQRPDRDIRGNRQGEQQHQAGAPGISPPPRQHRAAQHGKRCKHQQRKNKIAHSLPLGGFERVGTWQMFEAADQARNGRALLYREPCCPPFARQSGTRAIAARHKGAAN